MATLVAPNELPKWVPGRVLAASDELGWNGVGLRAYHYNSLDVEVPALRDFAIISYRRGATVMERRFEGKWTKTHCAPSDVSLLTRAQRSHWHWTEDIEVCHVYLAERFLSGIAGEVMDRSVGEIELHDVLKTQDPVITAAVTAIGREAKERALGGALYVEAVGSQLAVHLLRNYASVTCPERKAKGGLSPAQASRITDYIDSRLDEPLELATLAAHAGMGIWTFTRHFRKSVGKSPHAYVTERRIERARRLLAQGCMPIKEVACACGFSDQAHMTRVFQAHLKTTPGALRS